MASEEPEWTELVDIMYREPMTVWNSQKVPSGEPIELAFESENDDVQLLAEKTGWDEDKVLKTLRRLREGGLVSSVKVSDEPRSAYTVGLTEMGMTVAHERSAAQRENQTNNALVMFTFALVSVGIIELIPPDYVFTILGLEVSGLILRLVGSLFLMMTILMFIRHEDQWP